MSLNYSLTIDHNYIYGGFFVNIICVFKSIYLTTLFLKSYLILHVLMFSQNFVDGTHTPWNLSNEFYKTTMCCFFCVFSKQFLKLQMHACLIYFLRKKMVKTTFARRRHAWSWKYPVFTPLSNPSRFHERLPFISDHFFENNISL